MMNQEYENYVRNEDSEQENQVAPTRCTPFVPREPKPSEWPVAEKKLSITRGEQLFIYIATCFLAVVMLVAVIFFASTASGWTAETPMDEMQPPQETLPEETVKVPEINKGSFADGKKGNVLYENAEAMKTIDLSGLTPSHAVLADVSAGKIIAASPNGADQKVYPASITKVMTLIVVVEHLRSEAALQEIITVSDEVFTAMNEAGSSGQGFAAGEKLTVEGLLYALFLKSDGVAACELAKHIAGSEAAFVALMNQKAQAMGLTGTHFTNPTGLHDENHYSTCRDLATLLGYAVNMSFCQKIMTEDEFATPSTLPDGFNQTHYIYHYLLRTLFNKYQDANPASAGGLTIIAGKTGNTDEAKYCLATCAKAQDGSYYVCVTVGADSYRDSINAYQRIYGTYITE